MNKEQEKEFDKEAKLQFTDNELETIKSFCKFWIKKFRQQDRDKYISELEMKEMEEGKSDFQEIRRTQNIYARGYNFAVKQINSKIKALKEV